MMQSWGAASLSYHNSQVAVARKTELLLILELFQLFVKGHEYLSENRLDRKPKALTVQEKNYT